MQAMCVKIFFSHINNIYVKLTRFTDKILKVKIKPPKIIENKFQSKPLTPQYDISASFIDELGALSVTYADPIRISDEWVQYYL